MREPRDVWEPEMAAAIGGARILSFMAGFACPQHTYSGPGLDASAVVMAVALKSAAIIAEASARRWYAPEDGIAARAHYRPREPGRPA